MRKSHLPTASSLALGLIMAASLSQGRVDEPGKQEVTDPVVASIHVGPRADFGREAMSQRATRSVIGGLVGRTGIGTTQSAARPTTRRDPTRRQEHVVSSSDVAGIRLRARGLFEDDELLISQHIEKAEERGTFHQIYLVDCQGRIRFPERIELFEIWSERGLSVSWSRTTSANGEIVNRQSGGFSHRARHDETGAVEEIEGHETTDLEELPGIWEEFGFERAYAGPRSVGARFDLGTNWPVDDGNEWLLVSQVTRPLQDPVVTAPITWRLKVTSRDVAPELEPVETGTTSWADWRKVCASRRPPIPPVPSIDLDRSIYGDPWKSIDVIGERAKLIQSRVSSL